MRYAWVKKGIELLIRGTQANKHDTRLYGFLSWFFGNKLGRSDEQVQYRRLFRDDKDFHDKLRVAMRGDIDSPEVLGPDRKPDNWLVGRWWQLEAVSAVERGAPIAGKAPLLFYQEAPLQRIYYAKAIESEGWFDASARSAWKNAGVDWVAYGMIDIPTSWGHTLQLESLEREQKRIEALRGELDAVVPGAREALQKDKLARLPNDQQQALKTPEMDRTPQMQTLAATATSKTAVSESEIADRAAVENQRAARALALRIAEAKILAARIEHYRVTSNYAYWRARCEVEQTDRALSARRNMFEARKAFDDGRLERAGDVPGARELFESAWQDWAAIYAKHPDLMEDVEGDIVVEAIDFYRVRVLRALDINTLPADFPLFELLRRQFRVPDELRQMATPGEVREATQPEVR
jgi:hypothetical protein